MIDLDQTLSRTLTVLADAEPVAAPPLATIVERATQDERARVRVTHRPRRLTIAIVAGGVSLGVGGAAIAGVLPGPVTSAFHRMSDWGGPCRIDRSDTRLVASTPTPNGSTLEWWASSTVSSDHVDESLRTVAPDGRSHDDGLSCGPRMPATTHIVLAGGATTPSEIDFWGQAPVGTTSLTLTLSDGSNVAVPLQGDRNFIASFAGGPSAPRPKLLTARAADGSVIDTGDAGFGSTNPRG